MKEELKPCPFCGGSNLRHGNIKSGWRRVRCSQCCAEGPPINPAYHKGPTSYDTSKFREEAAFTVWNTRAHSPEVTALVEAARAFMLDCEQGADPISKECRARGDTYGRLQGALAPFEKTEGRDNG